MAVLVTDDFGTDTSANYNGAGITIASGLMGLDEDGLVLHSTATTGTQIWARYIIDTLDSTNCGFAIGDASGNGFFIRLADQGANLRIEGFTEYDTYTTYANNDSPEIATIGTGDRTKQHGITWDLTANEVRIWDNVTDDEPTAIDTWNGAGPQVGPIDYSTESQTQDGNYLGWGSWNTGTPSDQLTFFAFGTVGGAAGLPGSLVGRKSLLRGLIG